MSQFSRRARWLNTIFPASVAPTIRDPGQRSDDVSLVQQYDGGGYGFQKIINFEAMPAGASGNIDILTVAVDEVFRLFGIETHAVASGGGTVVTGLIIDLVSPFDSIPVGIVPVLSGNPTLWDHHVLVIPPDSRIQISYAGGVAGTIIGAAIYGFRCPLGTVFHV